MRRRATAAAIALLAVVVLFGAGTGGKEDRVALAITGTTWDSEGRLVVHTECARVTEGRSSAGDLPTITLWGSPKVGRCHPTVVVAVPPGTTKIVDAATSQVIDLPTRPGP